MKKLSKEELKTELKELLTNGKNDITLDKEDLEIIINGEGSIVMSIVDYTGKNAAHKSVKLAIDALENDHTYLVSADSVLVHFTHHPNYPSTGILEVIEIMNDNIGDEPNVFFCTTTDGYIPIDTIHITFIAIGLKKERRNPINNPSWKGKHD